VLTPLSTPDHPCELRPAVAQNEFFGISPWKGSPKRSIVGGVDRIKLLHSEGVK